MRDGALPTLAAAPRATAPRATAQASAAWIGAARRARQLSWLSLIWMGAEGAIAITAGVWPARSR
jgi:hypothetical protein